MYIQKIHNIVYYILYIYIYIILYIYILYILYYKTNIQVYVIQIILRFHWFRFDTSLWSHPEVRHPRHPTLSAAKVFPSKMAGVYPVYGKTWKNMEKTWKNMEKHGKTWKNMEKTWKNMEKH